MSKVDYQKTLTELQQLQEYKVIVKDFKFMIKTGIIEKQVTDDISQYTLIPEKELNYQYLFKFYKSDEPNVYAFIAQTDTVKNDPNKFEIFVMDYSDAEIIKEIREVVGEDKPKSSNTIKDVLKYGGYVWIFFGALSILQSFQEGGFLFLIGIGLISFGVVFVGLSVIIRYQTYLQNLIEKQDELL